MDKNVELLPYERLSIVPDPTSTHGKVYRAYLTSADIASGQKRAEWHKAYRDCDGNTKVWLWEGSDRVRYIGWRSLLGGDVVSGGNYLQWKGDSTCGGPAVGMTVRNSRLTLRTIDGNASQGGVEGVWTDPALLSSRMGQWTTFVMAVHFSKTTGWIEFWVNGAKQTMLGGSQRFEGPTVCPNDARVWTKWGVYGFDSGSHSHLLESPRIGTSYLAVAPS